MRIAALRVPSQASIASSSLARRQHLFVVSPRVFTCCWLAVLAVHVTCAAFIFALAGIHALAATPWMFTYLASSLQIELKFLVLAARTFVVVMGLHLLAIGRILFHSIRRRQLCFRGRTRTHTALKPSSARERSFVVSSSLLVLRVFFFPMTLFRRWWRKYFGMDGLFGFNGPHFDAAFHVREVLEILSQTYQAYFLSVLMGSAWINRLAVAIIFLGCVSTALGDVLLRRRETLRRFVHLVADTVLDMCSSVVIPSIIVYQSLREFDWQTMLYPLKRVYDDAWMARQVSLSRMLFVWSYLDYLSTVILQVSLLGCILTIERVLEPRPRARTNSAAPPESLVGSNLPVAAAGAASASDPRTARRRTTLVSHGSARGMRARARARTCMGHHAGPVFLAWGIGVLIAHIQAQWDTKTKIASCAVGINPWFSTKPGCAAVSINCHRLGIAGEAGQVARVLDEIEAATPGVLSFMHCPALVIPDIVASFSNLMALKLTNVTLVKWPESAALHHETHHSLSHIAFGHVTLFEFPEALLSDQLPLSLTDLDFSYTNLTRIPDSIGELWSNRLWMRINWEHANLSQLPASLAHLPIHRLSLIGNHLTSIDDEMLANDALAELYISGNPIQRLPVTMGDRTTMERLFAEHTLVNETNAWFADWYANTTGRGGSKPTVFFFGSPACDPTVDSGLTQAMWSRMCAMDMDTVKGTSPWDVIWTLRPL